MDVTIGYGGTPQREPLRPVFVVRGSERAAAVGDEGWSEMEQAFFVGGAVLDDNVTSLATPPADQARRWALRREALLGAATLLGLAALLVAAAL
jgi:hypothetical protein